MQNPDPLICRSYVAYPLTNFAEALRAKVTLLVAFVAGGIPGWPLLPLVSFSSTACAFCGCRGCRFLGVLRLSSVRGVSLVGCFVVNCCDGRLHWLFQDLLLLVYGFPLPYLRFGFLQCEVGIHLQFLR